MRINKLINRLNEISEEHGNVDVFFRQEDEYIGDQGYAITEIHNEIDLQEVDLETVSFVNCILKGG